LRFSLKTMLAMMLVVSVAMWTLIHPGSLNASTVAATTVVALVAVLLLAFRVRSKFLTCVAVLGAFYLLVADGGFFQNWERSLPTEWALEESCPMETVIISGLKPSDSLSVSLWRMLHGKEKHIESPDRSSVPVVLYDLSDVGERVNLRMPVYAATTVNTVVTFAKRDCPKNKPTFILGHCWFVLFTLLVAFFVLTRNNDSVFARSPADDSIYCGK